MEVTQLMAPGLTHCIDELSNRSYIHVVDACKRCRLVRDTCKCTDKDAVTEQVALPLDATKHACASRIALDMDTEFS